MDSFTDIVGPIVATTTFNCKEEHADEVAQFFSDVIHYLREEIAKKNGYRYGKCVRDGNKFYCWEEFDNAEVAQRIHVERFKYFRTLKMADYLENPVEPVIKYYPGNALPPPSDKARLDGLPEHYEKRSL